MTISQQLHKSRSHELCMWHIQLADTLDAIQARQIASINGPNGSTVDFYSTSHGMLLVQRFAEDQGFEVYAPICNSARIADTLNAIRALGILQEPA